MCLLQLYLLGPTVRLTQHIILRVTTRLAVWSGGWNLWNSLRWQGLDPSLSWHNLMANRFSIVRTEVYWNYPT